MINIRHFSPSDFPMILDWWASAGEPAPTLGMMPLDSSFVAEVDGVPALAVALYLTNSPEVAWAECFVGNPAVPKEARKIAATNLSGVCFDFAKSCGYRRLLAMSYRPALTTRYQELGFEPVLNGITTLKKELA